MSKVFPDCADSRGNPQRTKSRTNTIFRIRYSQELRDGDRILNYKNSVSVPQFLLSLLRFIDGVDAAAIRDAIQSGSTTGKIGRYKTAAPTAAVACALLWRHIVRQFLSVFRVESLPAAVSRFRRQVVRRRKRVL